MPRIPSLIQTYDVWQCSKRARAAIRNGDIDTAERWLRLAQRAAAIAHRLATIDKMETAKHWPRNPTR
ncbi:MAG: hypothetical protein KF779_09705 [Hyphomonadaceae bacterium]|nr:hypothetical protein [Hyphomonadaceae bacterium]